MLIWLVLLLFLLHLLLPVEQERLCLALTTTKEKEQRWIVQPSFRGLLRTTTKFRFRSCKRQTSKRTVRETAICNPQAHTGVLNHGQPEGKAGFLAFPFLLFQSKLWSSGLVDIPNPAYAI